MIKIIKLFCEDITADKTSDIQEIRRWTINNRYNYFREVIYLHCRNEKDEVLKGKFELDENIEDELEWRR